MRLCVCVCMSGRLALTLATCSSRLELLRRLILLPRTQGRGALSECRNVSVPVCQYSTLNKDASMLVCVNILFNMLLLTSFCDS